MPNLFYFLTEVWQNTARDCCQDHSYDNCVPYLCHHLLIEEARKDVRLIQLRLGHHGTRAAASFISSLILRA
jgi:hypothetical protein